MSVLTREMETSFEDILVNWENNKETFMLWLKHACGVDDKEYDWINSVVKDKKDIDRWIDFYDGSFDSAVETTVLYIESKN